SGNGLGYVPYVKSSDIPWHLRARGMAPVRSGRRPPIRTFALHGSRRMLERPTMESVASHPPARLAGLKVLVIDDSKTIRRTAETLLTREGCEVHTAVDGFDALSKIADHPPDIV